MAYLNTKTKIADKILIILSIYLICAVNVFASSFSSTFSLNDEALDFANSSEHLYGSNASMDLSSIFWTSRIMESASYSVIDSNSDLSSGVTPPGPGGGGGEPVAGGRPDRPGEKDSAQLITLPAEEKPQLDLHEAPEIIPEIIKPEQPQTTYGTALKEDLDGCSIKFENKFMKTNPYDYDSDNDGVGDCDEQFVYGLNPLNNDKTDDHTGLALFGDYIYTEERPFLVGRADFGTNTYENTKNLQIQLEQMDPVNILGLFFIQSKKDLNFSQYTQLDLQNDKYKARLYLDGLLQNADDYFKVDNTLLYTELKLDIPEDKILYYTDKYIKLTGNTGENYGVVAIWQNDDFIDVSGVLSNNEGQFIIYTPKELGEGEYTVTLYGLLQDGNKIIQTNYQEIDFKIEQEKAVIINKIYADIAPLDYAAADIINDYNNNLMDLHPSNTNKASSPIFGFIAFLTFTLTGFYFLWKQKNI